ncbi:MAG: hypothetical protein KatS3mg110_0315 [Pirellulaceae bacterium]|nr:MAG: hypothetical protein KatS3mg110_0315 [Pirellulaceae bacterium]
MGFTDADLRELLNRLQSDPAVRQEFRNLLRDPLLERLTTEITSLAEAQRRTEERLGALTERVDQLAEAQRRTDERLAEFERRTEERFAALTERIEQLTEAQRRTEERLAALTERVDQLAEAQRQTEERLAELERRTEERFAALTERIDQLAEAQRQTEERLAALTERVDQLAEAQRRTEECLAALAKRTADLVGESLERRYRERAPAYFGSVLRRSRVLDNLTLEEALENHLSSEEICDVFRTDVVLSGKPRSRPEVEEVWLAVEVSSVIDVKDVRRVVQRSRLLARSGRPVVPVVAGNDITAGATKLARAEKVAIVRDGRVSNWDNALAAALASA